MTSVTSRLLRPEPPWFGGHLQTLRNVILRPRYPVSTNGPARLAVETSDGSGDALSVIVDRPPTRRSGTPLVLLVPGLTGGEDSDYVCMTARVLLQSGYTVARVNMRGLGRSSSCRGIAHAGRRSDLADVINALVRNNASNENSGGHEGAAVVGFSLGGNVAVALSSEPTAPALRAVASVSAPVDLASSVAWMRRRSNYLYQTALLQGLKRVALRPESNIARGEAAAVRAAKSIFDFDDGFIAPHHGFKDAGDYYRKSSALFRLEKITTPTLLISARDDPILAPSQHDATARIGNPVIEGVTFDSGGHLGFHSREYPWGAHNQVLLDFLARN